MSSLERRTTLMLDGEVATSKRTGRGVSSYSNLCLGILKKFRHHSHGMSGTEAGCKTTIFGPLANTTDY